MKTTQTSFDGHKMNQGTKNPGLFAFTPSLPLKMEMEFFSYEFSSIVYNYY